MVGQWAEIVLYMFAGLEEASLQFNGAPIICAVHYARYLILTGPLLSSYPHFYTQSNSERLSHLPKVTH